LWVGETPQLATLIGGVVTIGGVALASMRVAPLPTPGVLTAAVETKLTTATAPEAA